MQAWFKVKDKWRFKPNSRMEELSWCKRNLVNIIAINQVAELVKELTARLARFNIKPLRRLIRRWEWSLSLLEPTEIEKFGGVGIMLCSLLCNTVKLWVTATLIKPRSSYVTSSNVIIVPNLCDMWDQLQLYLSQPVYSVW